MITCNCTSPELNCNNLNLMDSKMKNSITPKQKFEKRLGIKKQSKNYNSRLFRTTTGNEEIDSKIEEEEDINSDEYISSSDLDGETQTYISYEQNTKKCKIKKIPNPKKNNKRESRKMRAFNYMNKIDRNNQTINTDHNFPYRNNFNFNNKSEKLIFHKYNKSDFTNYNQSKSYFNDNLKNIFANSLGKNNILFERNDRQKNNFNFMTRKVETNFQNKNNYNNYINKTIDNYKIKSGNNNFSHLFNTDKVLIKNVKKTGNKMFNTSLKYITQNKNVPQTQQNNNNNININIYNKNIIKDSSSINIGYRKIDYLSLKKIKSQKRKVKNASNNQIKKNKIIQPKQIINNPSNVTININKTSLNNNINISDNFNPIRNNKTLIQKISFLKHNNTRILDKLRNLNQKNDFKKFLLEKEYLTFLKNEIKHNRICSHQFDNKYVLDIKENKRNDGNKLVNVNSCVYTSNNQNILKDHKGNKILGNISNNCRIKPEHSYIKSIYSVLTDKKAQKFRRYYPIMTNDIFRENSYMKNKSKTKAKIKLEYNNNDEKNVYICDKNGENSKKFNTVNSQIINYNRLMDTKKCKNIRDSQRNKYNSFNINDKKLRNTENLSINNNFIFKKGILNNKCSIKINNNKLTSIPVNYNNENIDFPQNQNQNQNLANNNKIKYKKVNNITNATKITKKHVINKKPISLLGPNNILKVKQKIYINQINNTNNNTISISEKHDPSLKDINLLFSGKKNNKSGYILTEVDNSKRYLNNKNMEGKVIIYSPKIQNNHFSYKKKKNFPLVMF